MKPNMDYEDLMTSLETLAVASPAEQEKFLKSIANTEMGDQFREAMRLHQEIKANPENKDLSKSFHDAFNKISETK